ncbi:28S ribosomal protein S22, mitochondrial isoform X1 [Oncorhynchus mykiss]|uniref:28S ribosomal protein S22, mitochondrial isoform X1 n=1 Tax=Oncorhynchus mykiss TaxID=8022 RepID=UPI0018780F0E|nr:28S ribosomal protein S22, mitochondrial isoform X1 [Oncorhynchus mykiss]
MSVSDFKSDPLLHRGRCVLQPTERTQVHVSCWRGWQDAVSLVGLFNKVHPHSETAQEASSQQASGLDLLKIYAKRESQRAGYVELALQASEQTSAEIRLTVMHHYT